MRFAKKNLNINDLFKENANFGYLKLLLAWFWPVMIPIAMSKALNKCICPSSELIESDWQKILNNTDILEKNTVFGCFGLFLACYWQYTVPVWLQSSCKLYIHFSFY